VLLQEIPSIARLPKNLPERNCSITPGNSAWIAERAGFRRYDFVDNAQHFQVIPTKVGIQMFFFGVRLPSVIEQLLPNNPPRLTRTRPDSRL
jgi:hypothetical protein